MPSIETIYAFVEEVSGVPRAKLAPNADLEAGLGITGDDFSELVEQFGKTFNVDMRGYSWYFHHGDEVTFNPGAFFFKPPFRQVEHIPVTPNLLLNAATTGRWPVQYPSHKLCARRYDILATYALLAGGALVLAALLLRP
jgi:hypothetical protein